MKKDDVLKMVQAGFSKEEILELFTGEDKEASSVPEETPEETPAQEVITQDFSVMTEGISKAIIEAIQKSNVLNSKMPETPEVTGEDIIATVLDLIDE